MSNADATLALAEFEALLATYGADAERWPIERRASARALLALRPDARALLAEARALDQLLDHAPRLDAVRHAKLQARIVAAALAERPARTHSTPVADNVVPLRPRMTSLPSTSPLAASSTRRTGWQTGGVLAASLVLGLLIGGFGLTTAMLDLEDDDTVAALYADDEDRL